MTVRVRKTPAFKLEAMNRFYMAGQLYTVMKTEEGGQTVTFSFIPTIDPWAEANTMTVRKDLVFFIRTE